MTMQGFQNPFLDFLEETETGRRASFFANVGNFNQQQPFSGLGFQGQQFAANLFPQVQNRFLGALGNQINTGQQPNLRFTDFLRNNFDFRREFLRAPTFQTGRSTSGLVSPARFLFNR